MSDINKDGGPAFPVSEIADRSKAEYVSLCVQPGMSLRDWFAGMALPAMLKMTAGSDLAKLSVGDTQGIDVIAKAAYEVADSMLVQRNK